MFNSVDKFVRKISKTKSKSFSDELLRRLDLFLDNKKSKVNFTKNQLIIECDGDELKISLEKHGNISYEIRKDNVSINGQYRVHKNGCFVKVVDERLSVYDVDNIYSKDITHKETFKVFDRDGVEQFRRLKVKVDNYYEDKKTGEITLHDPDIMENYTENTYMWRANGKYILKRIVREHVYPDGTPVFINIKNSDDCFIRYQLTNANNKEIPDCGEFFGVDREVFFNYFQRKSTINDVVENFHSKKYVRPHAIEF